jgi:hypothetical protein
VRLVTFDVSFEDFFLVDFVDEGAELSVDDGDIESGSV